MRLPVTIAEVEAFLAVAENQSFSRAADILCITQPAVTGRISRLEATLGTRLIERTTKRVVLTAEGERFRLGSERVVFEFRMLLEGFGLVDKRPRGAVTVACTGGIAAMFMPGLLHAFSETHPDIRVRLRDLAPPAALEAIRTGKADLAIMAVGEDVNDVSFAPLVEDECVVVAPVNHPLLVGESTTLADVLSYPIVMSEFQTVLRRTVQMLADARGLTFTRSPESRYANSIFSMFSMVATGYGLMIQPKTLAQLSVATPLGVLRISDAIIPHVYGLTSSTDIIANPAAKLFYDYALHRASIASAEK